MNNSLRPLQIIIVIAWLLIFASCSHEPSASDRLLERIDSLSEVRPDSALSLLQQIPDSAVAAMPEATRMRYVMVQVKTLDKNYLDITADTLMQRVLRYYQSKQNRRLLPEAYFYTGRVCADLGDAPQAMDYYTQALDATMQLEQTDEVLHHRALFLSKMGVLSGSQNLMDDALSYVQRAYECDSILQDTAWMVYDLCDMTDYHSFLEHYDQAQAYVQKAEQLADAFRSEKLQAKARLSKASVYDQMGRYEEAFAVLKQSIPHIERRSLCNAYYSLSSLYYKFGQLDSASYYYREMLDHGTLFQKSVAYKGLERIAIARGDYRQAEAYYQQYVQVSDSDRMQTQSEATKRVQQVYNYQLHEKKAQQLEKDNKEKRILIICLGIGVLLVLSLSAILFYLYRIQKQRAALQHMNLLQYQKESYRQSEAYMAENNRQLAALRQQLQEVSTENLEHIQQQELQARQIENLMEQIQLKTRQDEIGQAAVRGSGICQKLRSMADSGKLMKDDDWQEIESVLALHYANFTKRLNEMNLSDTERKVCLLIKLDFSPTEQSVLIGRSNSSISMVRTRLYSRFFGMSSKPSEWDDYIRSL